MKNNFKAKFLAFGATVTVILIAFLAYVLMVSPSKPECAINGCDNEVSDERTYYYMHDTTPKNNNDTYDTEKPTSIGSYSDHSTSVDSSSDSSSYTGKPSVSSSSSYRSSYRDTYDDGYDDVYDDGEPDWDRYDSDDDYARGADDAMDDLEEEYGDDW